MTEDEALEEFIEAVEKLEPLAHKPLDDWQD